VAIELLADLRARPFMLLDASVHSYSARQGVFFGPTEAFHFFEGYAVFFANLLLDGPN
jgi:hypothetical protein